MQLSIHTISTENKEYFTAYHHTVIPNMRWIHSLSFSNDAPGIISNSFPGAPQRTKICLGINAEAEAPFGQIDLKVPCPFQPITKASAELPIKSMWRSPNSFWNPTPSGFISHLGQSNLTDISPFMVGGTSAPKSNLTMAMG